MKKFVALFLVAIALLSSPVQAEKGKNPNTTMSPVYRDANGKLFGAPLWDSWVLFFFEEEPFIMGLMDSDENGFPNFGGLTNRLYFTDTLCQETAYIDDRGFKGTADITWSRSNSGILFGPDPLATSQKLSMHSHLDPSGNCTENWGPYDITVRPAIEVLNFDSEFVPPIKLAPR